MVRVVEVVVQTLEPPGHLQKNSSFPLKPSVVVHTTVMYPHDNEELGVEQELFPGVAGHPVHPAALLAARNLSRVPRRGRVQVGPVDRAGRYHEKAAVDKHEKENWKVEVESAASLLQIPCRLVSQCIQYLYEAGSGGQPDPRPAPAWRQLQRVGGQDYGGQGGRPAPPARGVHQELEASRAAAGHLPSAK